jgi:epidermal growth factor receptor substrate 15
LYLNQQFLLQAESLAKKYEEKYKQVGEIASKLTIEEARFRDIQVTQ